MALGPEWLLQSASFLWIFTLLLSESQSKRTDTYYMEEEDCIDSKFLGGATVFSHHRTSENTLYNHNTECTMTFKAAMKNWKLMLRMIDLDIPDRRQSGICNDALYVFDDKSVYTKAMKEAGGNGGLCGNILPPTLYSSGPYMTVHFRTDQSGPKGKGFQFIITAISEDFQKTKSCGSHFQCANNWCIDEDLVCDRINHCGDYSDESSEGQSKCGEHTPPCLHAAAIRKTAFVDAGRCYKVANADGALNPFMTLGVTAAVAITVGSIVIFVVCIVAIVCCCRKSACKKADNGGSSTVTTTTTSVVTNGPPPPVFTHPHQGYHPIQPCAPPTGSMYTPLTRESFTHSASPYSSQPASCHRSNTPTSSKSGKSNRSNNSVTFSQGTEKISLPVNV